MKKTCNYWQIAMLILLIGCAPKSSKIAAPEDPNAPIFTDAGEVMSVSVAAENVRQRPNGKILGQLRKNQKLTVVKRSGNWVCFSNEKFARGWIWGPSVGYDYINLYNPATYFDSNRKTFYDIDYFRRMFSQRGEVRQSFSTSYELFFGEIGLGSHETTVLNVVEASDEIVAHGVTLFVERNSERITKIKVNYYQPMDGIENALAKSELPNSQPSAQNNGHVIWQETLVPGLIVDLERREWDSNWFSGLWFMLPDKK